MVSTTASMTEVSNMDNIALLQDMGYEVHVVGNFVEGNIYSAKKAEEFAKRLDSLNVKHYHIDFTRNFLNFKKMIVSYRQLLKIMKEHKFDFVHCYTPIGGAMARLVCKATKTKCMYIAHGFHFFRGGPISSWLIFYPLEKILSKYTDIIVTINDDDYNLARKKFANKKSRKTKVMYIPGVGIDMDKFVIDKEASDNKRQELGLKEGDIMLLSVGELNKNKNHQVVIRALKQLNNKKVKYFICGQGPLEDKHNALIKELGLEEQVHLLGFRTDIKDMCQATDIFVFPSYREGLPLSLMEAMACGKPSVVSNTRGNRDLVNDKVGIIVEPEDVEGWTEAIDKMCKCNREEYGERSRNRIEGFSKKVVNVKMKKIYENIEKI